MILARPHACTAIAQMANTSKAASTPCQVFIGSKFLMNSAGVGPANRLPSDHDQQRLYDNPQRADHSRQADDFDRAHVTKTTARRRNRPTRQSTPTRTSQQEGNDWRRHRAADLLDPRSRLRTFAGPICAPASFCRSQPSSGTSASCISSCCRLMVACEPIHSALMTPRTATRSVGAEPVRGGDRSGLDLLEHLARGGEHVQQRAASERGLRCSGTGGGDSRLGDDGP